MSEAATVEQRLDALERAVADLQRQAPVGQPWWERVAGSMKDLPEFDEVLRLGREARDADRPGDEPA
jgi:hypothetical protein